MIDKACQYHRLTAYERGRMPAHRLDWSRQPAFFKTYPGAKLFPLERPESLPRTTLSALYGAGPPVSASPELDFSRLSRLLLLSAVVTARSSFAEGEILYRSHPSAGALYPVELYLAWPGGGALPAGLFHYDLRRPALELIRTGRDSAFFDPVDPGPRPALVLSVVFERSAWKYRERAFRYLLLDSGHLLENIALGLKALGLDGAVELDFPDSRINRALGLDLSREAALALVRLGPPPGPGDNRPGPLSGFGGDHGDGLERDLGIAAEYPLLHEVGRVTASCLVAASGPAAAAPENAAGEPGPSQGEKMFAPAVGDPPLPVCDYVEALTRRRSRRNFTPGPDRDAAGRVAGLLEIIQNFMRELKGPRPELICAVTGIDGLRDGFYRCEGPAGEFVRWGKSTPAGPALGRACLDQRWVGLAKFKFLFFADLESWEGACGPRVYRDLNIVAGRAAQALYLAAESLGFGACGVGAFYDRELARAFDLGPGREPLYLVAVGPLAGPRR